MRGSGHELKTAQASYIANSCQEYGHTQRYGTVAAGSHRP